MPIQNEPAAAWDTPVVDSHVHVFTTLMPLVGTPRHKPAYSFTAEDLAATLDRHGVAMAVIAAASPWGDYNDYMISALRKYPRFRGTVILRPTVERIVLDEMKRDGVVGVRLPFISMNEVPDITTPDYRRFLGGSRTSTGTFTRTSRAKNCRNCCPDWKPRASKS